MLIIASELLFASMGAGVKLASQTLDSEVIVFMRNAFGLAIILPMALHRGGIGNLATRVAHLHLLRASAGVAAMYCFFYALGHVPLADGMLLKMTAPIFIPLLVLLWLKERPGWPAIVAVPCGFAGVVLVLDPGGEYGPAALVGLLGGLLAAVAKTTVRRLTRTEPATRIVFYFAVLGMSIASLPMLWAWQTPSLPELGVLLLVGAAGTSGQLLLTRGYGAAPASQVAPFTYFSVVFGAAYGYLFWDEALRLQFVAGALLIAAAGVMALQRRDSGQGNRTAASQGRARAERAES
jgi:drug/metabolite transporter (DMT)-like permease